MSHDERKNNAVPLEETLRDEDEPSVPSSSTEKGTPVCASELERRVDPERREGCVRHNALGIAAGSISSAPNIIEPGLEDMDGMHKELSVLSKGKNLEQGTGPNYDKGDDVAETGSTGEPKREGTMCASLVSMGMTVMGFGLLSLPSAFAKSGLVPATVLIIGFGMLTDVSLCMLIKVAHFTKQRSMEGLAEYFYGHVGRRLASWTIIMNLFMGSVAACTIFMETWGRAGDEANGISVGLIRQVAACTPTECHGLNKVTVGLAGLAMIFPMLLRESLHELRHASMLAGICLFVSIGIFSYTYLDLVNSGEFDPVHASMRYTTDFVGFCSALGIAFMCFLCQFNILQVDSELKKPEQIYAIIHLTILGVAIPVNVFIGACGYFLFGSTVEGNVFDSMHSTVGNVAAGAVALTSLLKLPLIFKPFKDTLFAELGVKDQKIIRAVIIAGLALISFLVAIFVNLADVSAIGGSFCGAAIGFFFPGLFMFASALGIKSEEASVAESAHEASEKGVSPDDITSVAAKTALMDKFVSEDCVPPIPEVSLSTSTVDTDRGAELALVMRDVELLPVSEDVAPPSSNHVDGNDDSALKISSSFIEQWKNLSAECKQDAVQGLFFCALGVVCGTVGVSTALVSVLRAD
eukprot:GEMP01002659.1.p1 GENE.GEMP01002659.1~~GEMP01002659.1.p1  ORF type:complete len:637 (+),score=118.15 GEMP01002659.1:196-2106(+)